MGYLKIAMIGANGSGTKRTIPALFDSDICRVTAIQSRNAEKMESTVSKFPGISYYTSAEEMLRCENYDLIYIANPPFLHKDSIQLAAEYQKPIFCEKPLAQNFEEANSIKNLLNGYTHPVGIAHQMRHQKAYYDLKKLISEKSIGEIIHVNAEWCFKLNLNAASSSWKLDAEKGGGGSFMDVGIHVLDFIQGLFGTPLNAKGVGRIEPFKEAYSSETMLFEYPHMEAAIHTSHLTSCASNSLTIIGTEGRIEASAAMGEKSIAKLSLIHLDSVYEYQYEQENLYKNEVEDFVKYYILHDVTASPGTTVEEAVILLKLIENARSSY